MPVPYVLDLRHDQEAELRDLRDHAALPYLRERAAVLLGVAEGYSIRQCAQWAGLKAHDADTVCEWVHRYQQEGVAGLRIRQGRGRKPASFRGR
jgi:transposase